MEGMPADELLEEWNMAKGYFYRLNSLLTGCCDAMLREDYYAWYKILYRIYVEIEAKITDKKNKETAVKLLSELIEIKNKALSQPGRQIPISAFINFELFLRQILNDNNMLTPRKDTGGL